MAASTSRIVRLHGYWRLEMRLRRGTSLVEVMTALTLLAIGLLALAAATATLARHRRAAHLATVAVQLAAGRAARVAACVAEADGTRDVGALRERWTTRDEDGLRTVRSTVEHAVGARRWTFQATAACTPP